MAIDRGRPVPANQGNSDDVTWHNLPEGNYRFTVGAPIVQTSRFLDKDGNTKLEVRIPLQLTEAEMKRLREESPAPPGTQQSNRPTFPYSCGWSLGPPPKGKAATSLADFISSCFGNKLKRKCLEWFDQGAWPPVTDDMSDEEFIYEVQGWVGFVEGLEIIGSILHKPSTSPQYGPSARFGGPQPIGIRGPGGVTDDAYEQAAVAKLRAWMAVTGTFNEEPAPTSTDLYEQVLGKLERASDLAELTKASQFTLAHTSDFKPGELPKLQAAGKTRREQITLAMSLGALLETCEDEGDLERTVQAIMSQADTLAKIDIEGLEERASIIRAKLRTPSLNEEDDKLAGFF